MDDNEQLALLAYLEAKYPPPHVRPNVHPHNAAVAFVVFVFLVLMGPALLNWEGWGHLFIGGVMIGLGIVTCALALFALLLRRQFDEWWDQ